MNNLKKRFFSRLLCMLLTVCMIAGSTLTVTATTIPVSDNSIPDTSVSVNGTPEAPPSDSPATDSDDSSVTPPSDTPVLPDEPSDELPSEPTEDDTETKQPETLTISFYEENAKTLLFTVPLSYEGTSVYLNSGLANPYNLSFIKKGYALDRWYCVTNGKYYQPDYIYSKLKIRRDLVFTASMSKEPYRFSIDYNLNGGSFDEKDPNLSVPSHFTVMSETITLPTPQRANFQFGGWYKDAAFTQKVTTIPSGSYIDSDANGKVAPYSVYAKWISVKPGKPTSLTAKNSAKGKVTVKFKGVSNVDGYEVAYSTVKTFKKNKVTQTTTKKSLTITNLPKGKTYYFKVRAYKIDSTGEKSYGSYSSVKSCKVKNGVMEYTAKKDSGKLQKVSVKNKTDLLVQAKVSKRLKSSDQYYYLVKVDPNNGKILKQIAKTGKTTTVKFQIPLKDKDGNNHIQGKYGVAIKKGSKYMLITSTSYINNPEAAASYKGAFPTPTSKKGRQGLYNSNLGDKNYFVNFNLNTIIGTPTNYDVAYQYNGKTYYFIYPNFGNLSMINKDGGTTTVQVMLQWDTNCTDLILKSARVAPVPGKESTTYYAFNTDSKAAREKLEAAFCFLAEQGSKENYHVDNWILGNEVNTYANPTAKWYYAGNISRDKFMKNYASTFRMLYYAVKSNSKNSRVYICCDHTWINREKDWGTKYFTAAFHKEIKNQNKNIKWNLAYHAYSAVLTNADFWNDGSLAPNSENADFVSPKNLEILTSYVKKNFGKDVRIILSEQGFSCSGGVGSPHNARRQTGESVQAAAVVYLYYKAQFNDMIDAVIFSSGDHGGAGLQFDFIGREAENAYKYMDTPQYATYVDAYLHTIGASSWKSIVKGFSSSKLKKMPSR